MSQPSTADDPILERRHHHRVREIFAEAYTLILPFFSAENRWANLTLDHLAYRIVREHYPELSSDEVHVLVVAVKRVHADGGLPSD